MGSSFCSPFLLLSLVSGMMTLKVIIVMYLVLVGFIEANTVSNEVTEATDAFPADEGVEIVPAMMNDVDTNNKSNDSEDTNEDIEQVEDMGPSDRIKRWVRPKRWKNGCCYSNFSRSWICPSNFRFKWTCK